MMYLREATLLDLLGVILQQGGSFGADEFAQAKLIAGDMSADAMSAMLFQQSAFIYALATEAEPGKALAVGGFLRQRAGVLRSWMFALDEAWELYPDTVTAYAAETLRNALESAHRIEAICLDSRTRVHRWYTQIGLQKETTLTRYCTDGSDAALFVLIRSEQ
jgi:hypothetical protein